jgi:hypothetical protein
MTSPIDFGLVHTVPPNSFHFTFLCLHCLFTMEVNKINGSRYIHHLTHWLCQSKGKLHERQFVNPAKNKGISIHSTLAAQHGSYNLALCAFLLNFSASRTPRSIITSSEPPERRVNVNFAPKEVDNIPGTIRVMVAREIASIRAPCPVLVIPKLLLS